MRVLTVTSLFPNSLQRAHGIFVYRRVAAMAEIPGNEVEVIAPVPFVPRGIKAGSWALFARVPRVESFGGLRVHHPRYTLLPKISMPLHGYLMYLGIKEAAGRLHRLKPFDCIDGHYVYPDGMAAVMLARSLRLPVVVSARGTDLNLFPSFATIRPMVRWTLQNSSGVVTVSSGLKDRAMELGVPDEKVQVIGNGVDPKLFHLMGRGEARQALDIPRDSRVLVSVASLRPSKGHDLVIGAVAKLASRQPGLKLFIVGEGSHRQQIQELVQECSLQNNVFLVGNRSNDEIKLWLNAADLSILSSANEGWPNVILESLACGTPVIASRVGQIPEILSSGDLGILVDRTVDSISSAIDFGLARSWDRLALQNFAYGRPWSKVAQEVDQYLNHVVTSSAPMIARPALAP